MDKKQSIIEIYVSHSDYIKGRHYLISYLSLSNKEIDGEIFEIESERTCVTM